MWQNCDSNTQLISNLTEYQWKVNGSEWTGTLLPLKSALSLEYLSQRAFSKVLSTTPVVFLKKFLLYYDNVYLRLRLFLKMLKPDISSYVFNTWIQQKVFFFQAEDGIRDAQESRGLGDVYKRQIISNAIRNFDGKSTSSKWLVVD